MTKRIPPTPETPTNQLIQDSDLLLPYIVLCKAWDHWYCPIMKSGHQAMFATRDLAARYANELWAKRPHGYKDIRIAYADTITPTRPSE